MNVAVAPENQVDIAQQSAKLLGHYTGYVATWTIELGLRRGIFARIASESRGTTPAEIAEQLGFDNLYTTVWCRSAYAAGLLDTVAGAAGDPRYILPAHLETLLLNTDAPGYLGGIARTFVALRESFLDIRGMIETGKHEWWNDFDLEWIEAVSDSGQAFYRRILNVALPRIPAAQKALAAGGSVLDLACGVCNGPIKIARDFPDVHITAVDGDSFTLDRARDNVQRNGLSTRFDLQQSKLEELTYRDAFDVAVINISLHESRDIERVVANALRSLKGGGTFLVSEFPFPETIDACRTLPAQIMCGIQYFEAHIGCQLLPTSRFVELLNRAGFRDVGVVDVTPVHAVIHGTK